MNQIFSISITIRLLVRLFSVSVLVRVYGIEIEAHKLCWLFVLPDLELSRRSHSVSAGFIVLFRSGLSIDCFQTGHECSDGVRGAEARRHFHG